MASKDAKAEIDATVLDVLRQQGLTDVAVIRGEEIDGYFSDEVERAGDGDGLILGGGPQFDCRESDLPTAPLEEGEEIEITGYGPYRFLRAEPDSGGRVLLILGAVIG